MRKRIEFFDDPTDFSLVQGGPLFQILLRTGLLKPPTDLVGRRVVVVLVIAWMPLLLLSLLSGHAFGGVGVPFFSDLGAQARFLLCVPLLLVADVVVHRRIKVIVRQFLDRAIVASEDQPRFESAIASAMRLRNSVLAELLVLAFAITAGAMVGNRYVALDVPTWMAFTTDGRTQVTAAGHWYFLVSMVVFRFLVFRWYFRLFVWCFFLWQVSRRVPLRLNALHPDRAGGLGFLSGSVYAVTPVLVAHTIALSGSLGSKILHEGATLAQFKLEIVLWLGILMALAFAPLFFFIVHLADAKRTALRDYGIFAMRHVTEFRQKWIDRVPETGEALVREGGILVGTGDIQSLADLANSFEIVQETGVLPFGKAPVIRLAIVLAVPLLPLVLTMIPIEQLIDRALGVLF